MTIKSIRTTANTEEAMTAARYRQNHIGKCVLVQYLNVASNESFLYTTKIYIQKSEVHVNAMMHARNMAT